MSKAFDKPVRLQKRVNKAKFKRSVLFELIRNYYNNLSIRQFKALRRVKNSKFFFGNLLTALETKIDIILFRLGFFNSTWEVKRYLKLGLVSINGEVVRTCHTIVPLFGIITIDKKLWMQIFKKLKVNLKKKVHLNVTCLT